MKIKLSLKGLASARWRSLLVDERLLVSVIGTIAGVIVGNLND